MEAEHTEVRDYVFLEEEAVEKYFADVNIKLLSGRHIHPDEYNLFSLLTEYEDQFTFFYGTLYKLRLTRGYADQTAFYYLDFFDGSKGKIYDPSRSRALTELQTITGLMLLDMYYTKFFDHPKEIRWADIRQEILEGERAVHYQRLLFDTPRQEYSPREWEEADKKFKAVINSFQELGWVKKLSVQNEDLHFIVNPSIHRMAVLYAKELADFEAFSHLVKPQEESA